MLSKAEFHISILKNKYIPQKPTRKQAIFLVQDEKEGLFGGQAGGGKSSTILMAALQYVSEPNYSALILRRSYADLSLPGAIMDRANEWLRKCASRPPWLPNISRPFRPPNSRRFDCCWKGMIIGTVSVLERVHQIEPTWFWVCL